MTLDPGQLDAALEHISSLPVELRAGEYSLLHRQLGELLEAQPVQLEMEFPRDGTRAEAHAAHGDTGRS